MPLCRTAALHTAQATRPYRGTTGRRGGQASQAVCGLCGSAHCPGSVAQMVCDAIGFWDAQAACARESGVGLAADFLMLEPHTRRGPHRGTTGRRGGCWRGVGKRKGGRHAVP
ncbi:hypothetical protein E2562_036623 [Oryza meyeriana var. granulata]|uniref:Uncharacterized protein n=1 Tax=Oryza meyeriana var. granulata TaxID=110450 RepID=A0A6G1BQP0_9ORYZ|nr:hypothetical protein E2562_036623 [Oryza meyeriana var. granulata]